MTRRTARERSTPRYERPPEQWIEWGSSIVPSGTSYVWLARLPLDALMKRLVDVLRRL